MSMIQIQTLVNIAQEAGKLINEGKSLKVTYKKDQSPLTYADLVSHEYICTSLKKYYPFLPILSEESVDDVDYNIRKYWERFFLVDPLDGTKEFLKDNGEFTINIALIEKEKPKMGVIHAPARQLTYYAELGCGAFKIDKDIIHPLSCSKKDCSVIRIGVSRSHLCEETKYFITKLKEQNMIIEEVPLGSALKFGYMAEGVIDLYPRFSPTMEWDTAAGQLIVTEAGKKLFVHNTRKSLTYNKSNLVNPGFLCLNEELYVKVINICEQI